jgi:hypothetical protein
MRLSVTLNFAALLTAITAVSAGAAPVVIQTGTYTGMSPVTGTLPNQNTVLYESIPVATTSNFSVYTTSYANGGFQPNLAFFNPAGVMVGAQMVMAPPGAKPDPTSGAILDIGYTANKLAPGTYTLVLSDWQVQQSLTATNLSSGFVNMGNGTSFVDEYGLTRTGNYNLVLNLTPNGPAAAPEPATALLLIPATGLIYLLRKIKKSV